ncbi:hypothetical protein Pgy4_41879, partial [Pseudomonas savastanoi pv. glycinea str. race 4]
RSGIRFALHEVFPDVDVLPRLAQAYRQAAPAPPS